MQSRINPRHYVTSVVGHKGGSTNMTTTGAYVKVLHKTFDFKRSCIKPSIPKDLIVAPECQP